MIGRLLDRFVRLLAELRRRKVYQVALGYLAASFVAVELAEIAAGAFGLPGWFEPMVWALCGIGFPIALILAWALEVTPEGVRVEETVAEETEGSEKVSAPASTTRDLWVGASVLVLLLVGVWWMWGGLSGEEGAGSGVSKESGPEIQERSIAVLPFEVSGAGAEEWRDGMVTTLSLNLDGAVGLRAIADRTVFAAWNEAGGTEEGTSTEEALAVAREVGARYAVVGSAVQLAEDLRFAAEVYRTGSGERLGQVDVRGAPGSVTTLTNELTREVLGVLLERSEEAIPSVDLERITTSSLEALKSFLEGARRERNGNVEAAIEAYEAAVQTDSTFALAYDRLSLARWFLWTGSMEGMLRALRRAHALSDRLPKRMQGAVHGRYLYLVEDRGRAAADTLRRLTEAYPDEPTLWYSLGEVLLHGALPRGWEEADEAFARAVQLDPTRLAYHFHLAQLAFSYHRDSSLAAQRVAAHPAVEGARVKMQYRIANDLVFGGRDRRQAALARLDTTSISWSARWPLYFSLLHPSDKDLLYQVGRRLQGEKRRGLDRWEFPWIGLAQGRMERALTDLENGRLEPETEACLLANALTLNVPLPKPVLQARLEPSRIGDDASLDHLVCAGLYLIETGRADEIGPLIDRIRAVSFETVPQDEATGAAARRGRATEHAVDELNGYRAWKAGNLNRAAAAWSGESEEPLWSGSGGRWARTGAIWRGDLYRELGELKEAEGWYLAAWTHPVAHERLGRLYEEMERTEDAIDAYRRFIAAWKNADPQLQPRVEEARQRLNMLGQPDAGE